MQIEADSSPENGSEKNYENGENLREGRVNGEALLDALVAIFKAFVRLPMWAAEVLALWVVHTYAYRLRDTTTYLGVTSPRHRCGKTTLLHVLNELVHEPVVAAGVTSAVVFHLIHEKHPTLMIDEAEKLLRLNPHLEAMLNAGYKEKTAVVWRMVSQSKEAAWRKRRKELRAEEERKKREGEEGWDNGAEKQRDEDDESGHTVAAFSCYCPKVIARIGRFSEVLGDRCVPIAMRRKEDGDKCERLKKLNGEALREQCARFVEENAEAIRNAEPQAPEEFNDRQVEISEPLLVVG